jgi:hypothetical protein
MSLKLAHLPVFYYLLIANNFRLRFDPNYNELINILNENPAKDLHHNNLEETKETPKSNINTFMFKQIDNNNYAPKQHFVQNPDLMGNPISVLQKDPTINPIKVTRGDDLREQLTEEIKSFLN